MRKGFFQFIFKNVCCINFEEFFELIYLKINVCYSLGLNRFKRYNEKIKLVRVPISQRKEAFG